jgi:hypothetical protein
MMKINRFLAMAGIAGVLCLSSGKALAQANPGQGNFNFDPAQIQKMMMDNYRDQLEVKDDAEWKLIEERVQKVMDARREIGFGGGGMAMFGGMRRRGGDNAAPGGGQPGGGRRGQNPFAAAPSPEEEALQKAIEGKATNAELKVALAKYVEARKQKQATLEKAQAELRKLLSVRQEAIASISGLL